MNTVEAITATRLLPGKKVPSLEVYTLDGCHWKLTDQTPQHFTMIVFYRGLHCPLCGEYLTDLESKLSKFTQLGIEVITISSDSKERAQQSKEKWGLHQIKIGYELTLESMRQWGLYVSRGVLEDEPLLFNEPGLFLVKPDGILFFAAMNNAPYGRPSLSDLLSGIDYVLTKNYPVRGTD
ncbi:AhpC/TSA family protein [Nostocales cyanobacterium LEGE 11386]|nr:AhpC/TSA family protein [Nostocales cyanobacterium LEGE 11386]